MVVDVQRGDSDGDAGVTLEQFGFELFEAVGAAGAQRQVAALLGEYAGHTRTQARRRTGDQDLLPSHAVSVTSLHRSSPGRHRSHQRHEEGTCLQDKLVSTT
jgi:hypothetical protein